MSRSQALTAPWAIEETRKIFKKDMKVVIIGFSFFSPLSEEKYEEYYGVNSEYNLRMKSLFLEFGITNVEWINYYTMDYNKTIELIKNADVLYYPGGAPDLMYERIIEKDLLDILSIFNKIVVGSSAGAMIQLGDYHISPDYDYKNFSMNKGLGYINEFFIEVHYAKRKKQKKGMRKVRKTFQKPVYILPDNGMIIVNDGIVKTLNEARLYFDKKGIIK